MASDFKPERPWCASSYIRSLHSTIHTCIYYYVAAACCGGGGSGGCVTSAQGNTRRETTACFLNDLPPTSAAAASSSSMRYNNNNNDIRYTHNNDYNLLDDGHRRNHRPGNQAHATSLRFSPFIKFLGCDAFRSWNRWMLGMTVRSSCKILYCALKCLRWLYSSGIHRRSGCPSAAPT